MPPLEPVRPADGGSFYLAKRGIETIQIPEWITCSQCGTRRTVAWYSKNALARLRRRIYRDGQHILDYPDTIRCTECIDNRLQYERKCKICGETKALDEFARAQRRYPEPTCASCQEWMLTDNHAYNARDRERTVRRWEANRLEQERLPRGQHSHESVKDHAPRQPRQQSDHYDPTSVSSTTSRATSLYDFVDVAASGRSFSMAELTERDNASYIRDEELLYSNRSIPGMDEQDYILNDTDDFLLDDDSDEEPKSSQAFIRKGWLRIPPTRTRALAQEPPSPSPQTRAQSETGLLLEMGTQSEMSTETETNPQSGAGPRPEHIVEHWVRVDPQRESVIDTQSTNEKHD
ncbi:hypothetical protein N7532_008466 [Penicillium argentinense]|uniref:Stc1 domain-containing protein n=1 Tax=Penicillium argentinense TaxID=1131581 RepID=A0A9W9EXH8_9EURO|nr:uncharacterized protein N7532_008466 [Penicillium argentinense]KAJ5089782.1 hypothetical protein N7532_008466 [Penicillium argentinense]